MYWENYSEKQIKKNQIIRWRVNFTYDVTDGISPTVKVIREYLEGKLALLYNNDITDGTTVRFKKVNRIVTWHSYRQNYQRSYHQNMFVGQSIDNFNLWHDVRPFSPLPPFLHLSCLFFSAKNSHLFPLQSQHNSTSHNLFSHHNIRFVSICVLI
jgi:hypothetical protein